MSEAQVKSYLKNLKIETPSWGYANSGTRFKVFAQPGVPRNAFEKLDDAAVVHKLTGSAPSVAVHIPWDAVDDYGALASYAREKGLRIGAVNPNLFQENDYKLGSIASPDPRTRAKAVSHMIDCVEIAKKLGSDALSLWFPDGTNYPGQDSMFKRQNRVFDSLKQVYQVMPDSMKMLLEYKFFEPAFYHTDLPDWGTSYVHCVELGPKAQVLVDTGHHAPGTNIEYIVAFLLRQKRLGGFHFNNRNYADDDLMVGSADPFELFLIMFEIVSAGDLAKDVAYMLDQCHNIEPKIPAIMRSIMNVQEATAKALLVDQPALASAQESGDVLGAHAILMDAFATDVRPLVAEVRQELGGEADPIKAFEESGYQKEINESRASGQSAGWGA
jgi:L-rhamnose isomerase/sugar isomerase